jgi:hypothetical protein
VDTDGGKFYWTQKGGHDAGLSRIFGPTSKFRKVSRPRTAGTLSFFMTTPEPIDLDLDPVNRALYWTACGDPPRGNTMNRAPMDLEAENGKEPEILFTHLMEGIGLALDLKGGRMFITDFGGSVYSVA